MAVLRYEELFVVVQEFNDVIWSRGVYDRGGDKLVHGFVVARFARVVDEACAADVHAPGQEIHAQGFVM